MLTNPSINLTSFSVTKLSTDDQYGYIICKPKLRHVENLIMFSQWHIQPLGLFILWKKGMIDVKSYARKYHSHRVFDSWIQIKDIMVFLDVI